MENMNVCLGATVRFNMFQLAKQLEGRGLLKQLYTGYPQWKVDTVPKHKVRSFPWLVGLYKILGHVPAGQWLQSYLQWPQDATFDEWMSRNLEECDVFHAKSGQGLKSHRAARKKFGALTVCGRGSAHITYQDKLLEEEYNRWNVNRRGFSKRIIDRELAEYEETDIILVPSEFAKRSFLEKGISEDKVKKAILGVNTKEFYPVNKKDDVFRVLFVGTASLQKGVQYLLEAIDRIDSPNIELWLIGNIDEEARPILQQYKDKFKHIGFIPRTELHEYYSQGSVLVLPSIQEGLARVQAQAMACGLPIIATPHTGAEDLITNGQEGFIVPIRSPEKIEEKIMQMKNDKSMRGEMSKKALETVKSMNGWAKYASDVVKIYKEEMNK